MNWTEGHNLRMKRGVIKYVGIKRPVQVSSLHAKVVKVPMKMSAMGLTVSVYVFISGE